MDIPEFFCNRKDYEYLYGKDKAKDDFESFPYIFKHADGLIFNHSHKSIDKLITLTPISLERI